MNCSADIDARQPEDIVINSRNYSSWLSQIWNTIVKAFESSKEPTFWKKRVRSASSKKNRNGDVYVQGYAPKSNRDIYFTSEDEARIWLDQSCTFR